jgi:hypothetical protein
VDDCRHEQRAGHGGGRHVSDPMPAGNTFVSATTTQNHKGIVKQVIKMKKAEAGRCKGRLHPAGDRLR